MEKVLVKTTSDDTLNIFKFAVLQKMAIEYYTSVEDELNNIFESYISTKYKERFTNLNSKKKREIDKKFKEELRSFKARAKAYRQKNTSMYEMMDGFRHTEQEAIESCVEQIYDFIDKLITKSND